MRPLLLLITAVFAAFTGSVVAHTGLAGFYQQLLDSPAAWQTLVDITIALGLVLAWMGQDARRCGRRFWPWVPVTLLAGSFGPLLYLLLAPRATSQATPATMPGQAGTRR